MGTVTLPHLTKANTDPNLFSEVKANDQAIIDQVNGSLEAVNLASNAVTTAKITDANVTDAKLASPNNSVYKTITHLGGATGGSTTGTYYLALGSMVATGTATSAYGPDGLIYFDDADYTVAGLTQKLRIRQQVIVGSTSPSTVTLNCGLYPVTISSGNWTLGTVVASSTTTTTGLATNTISSFATSDFTVPADGAYCLGVVVGSITCPAGIHVSAQLQTRNV